MDEDLDKKNRKLQEDPDDFEVKNSIFTQESVVRWNKVQVDIITNWIYVSVNPFLTKDMSRKSLETVLYKYLRTSAEHLILVH